MQKTQSTTGYPEMLDRVMRLVHDARHCSAYSVNAVMTATYWLIGRHIVEFEQRGGKRADYWQALLTKLSTDLTSALGHGFGVDNLELFRAFYQAYPPRHISAPARMISESPIRISAPRDNERKLAAELDRTRALLEKRK